MAVAMRPTPVISGNDAKRFLREMEQNKKALELKKVEALYKSEPVMAGNVVNVFEKSIRD